MSKDLTTNDDGKEISYAQSKQKIFEDIQHELIKKGINHEYIVKKLKMIIDKSYVINNAGVKAPDYKTMLKGLELLLKLSGVQLDSSIKVAIFNNMPGANDKLKY